MTKVEYTHCLAGHWCIKGETPQKQCPKCGRSVELQCFIDTNTDTGTYPKHAVCLLVSRDGSSEPFSGRICQGHVFKFVNDLMAPMRYQGKQEGYDVLKVLWEGESK